jgi:hypothetical protein
MILAVVETHERENADALARRRESDKARQKAFREREAFTVSAPSRDETLPVRDKRDPSPHVGERAQVVTPSLPSLRSEELKTPTEPNGSVAPKGARPRGSRRVPDAWLPSEKTLATLTAENHSAGDLERALTRMRDYEFAKSRTDWDAAFRTWVRKDADRKPRNERPSPDAKLAARQANLDRHERGAELASRFYRDLG